MPEVGNVTYKISGDNSKLKEDVNESKKISESAAHDIGNAFSTAMKVASAAVVAAIGAALKSGVEYNARMEQYTVALTTALGNEKDALKAIAAIQQDAAKTPFDVAGLTQANMLLISTGESAEAARQVILALGDAVAASGGGNDVLQRMSANLQQIKNVGKATAMDIKQFAMAGINIYGMLSDYTGKTTAEVQKMDISYELLTEALKAAASEGGRYFDAMNAQSKTFNGQLSTLKDNAQMILGEISQGVFEKLANEIFPKINQALQDIDTEAIANAINFIIDALQALLPVIAAATTAWLVFAGALKIQELIQTLTASLTRMMDVMVAHPILAIVAALAALVPLIIKAATATRESRSAYIETYKAMEDNQKAHEENVKKINAERDNILGLIRTLDDLVKKENKTAAEIAIINKYIAELNELLPDANVEFDELNNRLTVSTERLYELAEALAYRNLMEEEFNALVADRQTLIELDNQRVEIQNNLNEALEEQRRIQDAIASGEYAGSIESGQMALSEANDKVRQYTEELDLNRVKTEEVKNSIAGHEQALDGLGQKIDETASKTNDASAATSEACEQMKAAVKSYEERWNETHASVKQAVNSEIGLFEDMSLSGTQSIENLISSLKSQTAYMDDYQKNINRAMELGVDEGLVKKLSDGSKESAEILAAIVKDGGKNIDELNEEFRRSEEGKEAFIDTLTTLQTTTEQDMQNMVSIIGDAVSDMNMNDEAMNAAVATMQGYLQGINQYEAQITAAYARIARAGQKTLAMVNDAHSPSRKFEKQGEYVGQGYAEGILKLIPTVETATIKLAEASMPNMTEIQAAFSASLPSMETINNYVQPAAQYMSSFTAPQMAAPVVLNLDGREIARATAWWTSEQMAWEEI